MVSLKIKRMTDTEVKIVDSLCGKEESQWGLGYIISSFLGLGGDYMAFSYHCTFSGKYVCYVCTKETNLYRNRKETQPFSLLRAVKIWEGPLEKAMAPHSSTLAWQIQGWRSLVGCSPWGREESDTTERLHSHFSLSCTGEGNGNPLQCSCLENPRDSRAWWAAVYGVGHDWRNLAAAAAAGHRGTPSNLSCAIQ